MARAQAIKSAPKFSKSKLFILGAVFAVVGAIALVATFAATTGSGENAQYSTYKAWYPTSAQPTREPLRQVWDNKRANHFFAHPSWLEYHLKSLGSEDQGVEGYVATQQLPGTVPLYELNSNAPTGVPSAFDDTLYTTNETERAQAKAAQSYFTQGFTDSRIIGYIFTAQQPGTTPLYRTFSVNSSDHYYTTTTWKRDNAIKSFRQYKDQGIVGYVYTQDEKAPVNSKVTTDAALCQKFQAICHSNGFLTTAPNQYNATDQVWQSDPAANGKSYTWFGPYVPLGMSPAGASNFGALGNGFNNYRACYDLKDVSPAGQTGRVQIDVVEQIGAETRVLSSHDGVLNKALGMTGVCTHFSPILMPGSTLSGPIQFRVKVMQGTVQIRYVRLHQLSGYNQ